MSCFVRARRAVRGSYRRQVCQRVGMAPLTAKGDENPAQTVPHKIVAE